MHFNIINIKLPPWDLDFDSSNSLRAVSWNNKLTGRIIKLGSNPELEVDIDASYKRIWIEGWRLSETQQDVDDPDQEAGYRAGYYKPELDDSSWSTDSTLYLGIPEGAWAWARTHVFLPDNCRGKDLTLFLGGIAFQCKYLRVFVNGHEVGVRHEIKDRGEPEKFVFIPGSNEFVSILNFSW